MIKQAYVLYLAVHDLDPVVRTFTTLLAVPPIPMHADMDVSGALVGAHFTTQGLYAIGLMALRGYPRRFDPPGESATKREVRPWVLQQRLAQRGEGACLIGFLVDDLEAHMARLGRRGVRFMTPEPSRNLVGRTISVGPEFACGVEILYNQHDPDAYDRWIATDPHRAPKDVQISPRRPHVVQIAVRHLAAATATFTELLQCDAVPMETELDRSGNLVGVHFPVNGLESVGLVALRDPTRRHPGPDVDPTQLGPWLVQRHLETQGEGIVLVGLRVDDLDAHTAALRHQGVGFVLDAAAHYAVGRNNFVDPRTTHGVTVMLAEHDPDAYRRWRATPAPRLPGGPSAAAPEGWPADSGASRQGG